MGLSTFCENRDLPWAIYISLTLVTLISILVNVADFSVISPAEMIASDATDDSVVVQNECVSRPIINVSLLNQVVESVQV